LSNLKQKETDILNLIFKQLKPKPKTDTLEFCKKYGVLSGESSSVTGRFVPYPFQELGLKATSDERVEWLIFMKSTRTGYTKTLNFAIAYHIVEDPCPQMIFLPNNTKAIEWSKKELTPLLRDMPIVDDRLYKGIEQVNLFKPYSGGFLGIAGLQTANNVASVTLKNVFVDEADRVPSDLDGEGDTFGLLAKRSESYYDGKFIAGSTPTIKYHSNIERLFNETDMRYRFYPCPFCGHHQILEFDNLRWDKEYRDGVLHHLTDTARFECTNCEEKIYQIHHRKMDKKARWYQTQKFYCCDEWQNPVKNGNWYWDENITIEHKDYLKNGEALCKHCNNTAEYNRTERLKLGVHLWAAMGYHAQSTWKKIAAAFIDTLGSKEKLKVFNNTWLGLTFEEKNITLESNAIMERAEEYERIPNDMKVITMTVDTQDNRLEYSIKAWYMGETSYNIEYGQIMIDPINEECWSELKRISLKKFKQEDGKQVGIFKVFIDMAGHRTDEVKKFVRKNPERFVMLKGDPKEVKENDARTISQLKQSAGDKNGIKDLIMWVATNKAKDIIFERLTLENNEYGSIHHNKSFDIEWYEMLTSERKVFKKNKSGFVESTYEKKRERNEAIDLETYHLAAIRLIQATPAFNLDLSIKEDVEK